MRRAGITLAVLFTIATLPALARAQFIPEARRPRAWLTLSDGFGPSVGGVNSQSDLVQLFRASGTVAVTEGIGIEASAFRVQQVWIGSRQFNDPSLTSARADGLALSFASLNREPRDTYPSSLVLGGTVLRRPTADPTRTRLTGGVMAGIEGGMWTPSVNWFDATAGGRLILMPAAYHHPIYLFAITFGLRFG